MATKESVLLGKIKSRFNVDCRIQRDRRLWVSTDKNKFMDMTKWLKEQGFVHLSTISVTDWLEEGKYELTYHFWSYDDNTLLTLKIKIDRKNPTIDSLTPIWKESAQIHERELHELFGLKFKGNPDLSPLFLEDWRGPPPFKKDFDWRNYVREEFYKKNNEREKIYYD